ncbi:MAG: histidine phosphatase family protein [Planctomycetes bacterium]|nr:histidine phosphatase family protein [Planctomycetota bacterium]
MILYLVRHAWADERDPQRWPDDAQRPLTEDGTKRFRAMVKRLVKRGMLPQQIYTSPLVRTVQTAQILRERLDLAAEPTTIDALAPGAQLDAVLAAIDSSAVAPEQAWVGHAPDVGDLLAELIGGETLRIDFAKGAVARIDFEGPIAGGQGSLRWLATAKLLGE